MKRSLRPLGALCVLCVLLLSLCAVAQQQPTQTQPPTTLKVDVKLVNVYATVLDSQGAPIGSLTKESFTVSEDGYQQSISHFERESDLPLSIVLAVDTSLSTRKDLRLEIESARKFIHTILRPRDRVMIMAFDTEVREVVRFTSDLKTIDRGLDAIHAGGATALYDAVFLASDALQNRQGRKVLVIVTDGGDTVSSTSYQQALRESIQSEALVYSVIDVPIAANAGRDIGGEHALIQLSHDTGGRYFYAASGADLDSVFKKIDEELRTQYLLAYYPNRRVADSSFRRITVDVTPPRDDEHPGPLSVRARSGYYTAPSR